ncbi:MULTISPECIES: hypothetical protein [Acinetobacter calcoaceticus/baumannii complex]|uniref:hypothetical protein n=1 Tax=Acinetobacter calcoaceticus/baumannii complex TaxID=909768 RepID=UPI000DA96C3E|nr:MULTISPECIES: hypothetical protein [Acinetobacter calcoaceticus/baumannii complex]AZC01645.1 hypothetical protein DKC18_001115 [Acinetobacter nosocomialis]MCX3036494.1 hypothetical protein [Acinetobacter baumannii]PZL99442.1 hypothetical protein DOL92_14265 [Acinetobacter nosocomialis]RZH39356.1 hypothetical protein EXD93_10235 [Acinetobacter pittii]HCE1008145.1 hypothetical protein [Acinetobacter baumannii]
MANSKDKFQKAIRQSLEQLQNSGEKITKTKIINNAKFEDGSSVGKTTLYAKNSVTKLYIHAELLKELDEKITAITIDKSKGDQKKSSKEIIEEKSKIIKELELKNSRLLAQFAQLEDSLENTVHQNNENCIQNLELNLYIVTSLLNLKIGGYKKLNNIIKNFEVKYHGSERLKEAKDQIQTMKNDIEYSKIISITEGFKDS